MTFKPFTIHINLFKFTTVGLQDRFNIWLVDVFSASVWLPVVSRHDNKMNFVVIFPCTYIFTISGKVLIFKVSFFFKFITFETPIQDTIYANQKKYDY